MTGADRGPRDGASVPRAGHRPVLLTLAAWAFILVGAGGILKDIVPLAGPDRSAALAALRFEGPLGLAFIWSVRALAVAGGVAVLRAHNWGRWLLAAWMIFHVGISLFHSPGEAAAHVVIFALLGWVLFGPSTSAWLSASRRPSP